MGQWMRLEGRSQAWVSNVWECLARIYGIFKIMGPVQIIGQNWCTGLSSGWGNPSCWHDVFNFDYCCHSRHGPTGHAHVTRCLMTAFCWLRQYGMLGWLLQFQSLQHSRSFNMFHKVIKVFSIWSLMKRSRSFLFKQFPSKIQPSQTLNWNMLEPSITDSTFPDRLLHPAACRCPCWMLDRGKALPLKVRGCSSEAPRVERTRHQAALNDTHCAKNHPKSVCIVFFIVLKASNLRYSEIQSTSPAKFQVAKANLATFCCHASSLSSHACWGAGSGEGSPELTDASTGRKSDPKCQLEVVSWCFWGLFVWVFFVDVCWFCWKMVSKRNKLEVVGAGHGIAAPKSKMAGHAVVWLKWLGHLKAPIGLHCKSPRKCIMLF